MQRPSQEAVSKSLKNKKIFNFIRSILAGYFYVFFLVLAVVILLSGYLLIIKPKYDSINANIASNYENQKTQKNDLQDYLIKLNKYKKDFDNIGDSEKDKINSMIEEKNVPEDLFSEFESLISNQGLILSSISIGQENSTADSVSPDRKKDFPAELGIANIDIDTVGADYKEMKNLLALIENNISFMDIKKLQFSAGDKSVKLTIDKYYLK